MANIDKKIFSIVYEAIDIYKLEMRNEVLFSNEYEICIDLLLDNIFLDIQNYLVSERNVIKENILFVLSLHERERKRTENAFASIK